MTNTDTGTDKYVCVIQIGKPVADSWNVFKQSDGIALIAFEINDSLYNVSAYRNTLTFYHPLHHSKTDIILPEFDGWSVWSIKANDCQLRICLTRDNAS